jgi:hypothetical protein
LTLSKAINVEKAVLERSKSITDKAEVKDWLAVRKEFDGALSDVKDAMLELGDDDLAQLVSVGGWIRGTEVLTSIIRKNYTTDSAELLHQPALVNFFTKKLDNLSNKRLAEDDLVDRIRKLLAAIAPLIGDGEGDAIPSENVTRIHKMTRDTVAAIASTYAIKIVINVSIHTMATVAANALHSDCALAVARKSCVAGEYNSLVTTIATVATVATVIIVASAADTNHGDSSTVGSVYKNYI